MKKPSFKPKKLCTLTFYTLTLFILSACAPVQENPTPPTPVSEAKKMHVITTLFPQYDFVKEIGKERVNATLLLPPGVEAHSYDPTPQDLVKIEKADLFIYTGEYMEPWAAKTIAATQNAKRVVIDTSNGITLMDEEAHSDELNEKVQIENGDQGQKTEEGIPNANNKPYEWSGVFNLQQGTYQWNFEKVNGAYADPAISTAILPATATDHEAIHQTEESAKTLFSSTPIEKNGSETLKAGQFYYQLNFDSNKEMTSFPIVIEKAGSYVIYAQHLPTEFESTSHYFKDSNMQDIEPTAQEPEGDHHHHHGGKDPHIWVDPVLAQEMVKQIVVGLIKADPSGETFYRTNGDAYIKQLQALDKAYSDTLSNTKHKTILYGGHFAFGYLAKRYGLSHESPYLGFAPDSEPTPQRITELMERMKTLGIKVIFYEELIDPKVAKVISENTGAEMLLLHGAHNLSKEELANNVSYLQIMKQNLEKLKIGLEYNG